MVLIILSFLYRLVVHNRLSKINPAQGTLLFKMKLRHYKQHEWRKTFIYLLVGFFGLMGILFLTLFQLAQIETHVQELHTRTRVVQAKQETKRKLMTYPTTGLQLKEGLMVNNQTIKQKDQREQTISEKLRPYIGEVNVVLSSGREADSLVMLLTGTNDGSSTDLVVLGQNITALMREVEKFEQISEVQMTIIDGEGNDLYKGSYIRNDNGEFAFQSTIRKGKG